jgi:ubiquitin-like protein Pup
MERVQVAKPKGNSSQYEFSAEDAEAMQDQEQQEKVARGVGEAISEELDEILDEIDGVLERNAAEFVNSYIQQGGQ